MASVPSMASAKTSLPRTARTARRCPRAIAPRGPEGELPLGVGIHLRASDVPGPNVPRCGWWNPSVQSPRSTTPGQGPHEVSRRAIASEITVPQSQGPPIGSLTQLGQWVVGQLRAVTLPTITTWSHWPRRSCLIQEPSASPTGRHSSASVRRSGSACTERQDHRLKVAIPHPFGHQTRQHARARQQPDSAAQSRPRGGGRRRRRHWHAACMASSKRVGIFVDLNQLLRHGTDKTQSRSAFDQFKQCFIHGAIAEETDGALCSPKRRPPRPRRILPTSQCPESTTKPSASSIMRTSGCMSGTTSNTSASSQPCSRSRSRSVMTPCTRPPLASPPGQLHPLGRWSRRRRPARGHAGPRRPQELGRGRRASSIRSLERSRRRGVAWEPVRYPHAGVGYRISILDVGVAGIWLRIVVFGHALEVDSLGPPSWPLDTAGHAGHVKVLRDVPNIGGLAFAAPSAGFGALGFGAWLGAGVSQWLA